MARAASARRYAEAAFQIARERDELEQWHSDLKDIAQALEEPLWAEVLESRKVDFETKLTIMTRAFPEANPLVLNLVHLLISRGRLRLIEQIAEEYEQLLDAYHGLEHAQVITAVPLEEEDKRRLAEVLSTISGKKVVLTTEVNPAILGGMVARLGDKVIDGSVRGRLESLKKRLVETAT